MKERYTYEVRVVADPTNLHWRQALAKLEHALTELRLKARQTSTVVETSVILVKRESDE